MPAYDARSRDDDGKKVENQHGTAYETGVEEQAAAWEAQPAAEDVSRKMLPQRFALLVTNSRYRSKENERICKTFTSNGTV
jgi:hypothetical protein